MPGSCGLAQFYDVVGDERAIHTPSCMGVIPGLACPIHLVSGILHAMLIRSMFLVAALLHWQKLSYWIWVRYSHCLLV